MTPWLADPDVTLYLGDALDVLRGLPTGSVHMCATSPPFFGLRDYGTGEWEGGDQGCDHSASKPSRKANATATSGLEGGKGTVHASLVYGAECGRCGARRVDRQIGLEATPDEWVASLVAVFREVRRVLRDDGTLWVEIGDSYGSNGNGGTGEASSKQNTNRVTRTVGGDARMGARGRTVGLVVPVVSRSCNAFRRSRRTRRWTAATAKRRVALTVAAPPAIPGPVRTASRSGARTTAGPTRPEPTPARSGPSPPSPPRSPTSPPGPASSWPA